MSLVIESRPDLGVTRLSRWIANCYVIHPAEGGSVVVDPGLPCAADDLAPVLRQSPGPVRAIVATHGHSDHVAGAAGLAGRDGGGIYLPARTLELPCWRATSHAECGQGGSDLADPHRPAL